MTDKEYQTWKNPQIHSIAIFFWLKLTYNGEAYRTATHVISTLFGTLFSAPLHGDGLKFPDTKFHRRGKLKTFEVQRPRFQKETKCKTFLMLMHVICMQIKICSDAVSSWTSFIAFWRGPKLRYKSVRENIFVCFHSVTL